MQTKTKTRIIHSTNTRVSFRNIQKIKHKQNWHHIENDNDMCTTESKQEHLFYTGESFCAFRDPPHFKVQGGVKPSPNQHWFGSHPSLGPN